MATSEHGALQFSKLFRIKMLSLAHHRHHLLLGVLLTTLLYTPVWEFEDYKTRAFVL